MSEGTISAGTKRSRGASHRGKRARARSDQEEEEVQHVRSKRQRSSDGESMKLGGEAAGGVAVVTKKSKKSKKSKKDKKSKKSKKAHKKDRNATQPDGSSEQVAEKKQQDKQKKKKKKTKKSPPVVQVVEFVDPDARRAQARRAIRKEIQQREQEQAAAAKKEDDGETKLSFKAVWEEVQDLGAWVAMGLLRRALVCVCVLLLVHVRGADGPAWEWRTGASKFDLRTRKEWEARKIAALGGDVRTRAWCVGVLASCPFLVSHAAVVVVW